MISLALAIACSLVVASIFKLSGKRGLSRIGLLAANYAVAASISWATLLARGAVDLSQALSPAMLLLGGVSGALFIGAFFLMALSTERSGMSLTVGAMRLSVVIPFAASWLIWDEAPGALRLAGMGAALGAFFLIAARPGAPGAPGAPKPASGAAALGALFLAMGVIDVLLKLYDERFAATHPKELYMALTFGVAFLIGAAETVRQRRLTGRWPSLGALGLGVVLGVVNYGTVRFFLKAIQELSGTLVFPVNSISLVIGGALLGVLVWRERLSNKNLAGLALAAAALVLLFQNG